MQYAFVLVPTNCVSGMHIWRLQVHPIAAVEIEVSPWSYEEETKKGK